MLPRLLLQDMFLKVDAVVSCMVVRWNYLAQARLEVGDFLFYFDVLISAGYGRGPSLSTSILQKSMGLRPHKLPLTVQKVTTRTSSGLRKLDMKSTCHKLP